MTPKQIIKYYGSQAEAARKLGRTRAAVNHWLMTSRIPYPVQCMIQCETNGALKASRAKRTTHKVPVSDAAKIDRIKTLLAKIGEQWEEKHS